MGAFAKSVLQNTKQVQQELNDNIIQFAQELFTDVVNHTPSPSWIGVSKAYSPSMPEFTDGVLANQWYTGENKISQEETTAKSDNGGDSLNRINELSKSKVFLGKDGYVSLTNNVGYAYRVEALGYPQGKAVNTAGYKPWNYWNGNHATPYFMVEKSLIKAKAKLK